MKLRPMDDSFYQLIDALLDETITPEQHAELQEILRNSPVAQREYHCYVDLHLEMKRVIRLPDAGETPPIHSHRPQPRRAIQVWKYWTTSMATLGLLIVLASFLVEKELPVAQPEPQPEKKELDAAPVQVVTPEPVPQQDVILTQAANAEFLREFVPAVGSALKQGHEYILRQGLVELAFPNGAIAILQAPAMFSIESPERLGLKIGKCSVFAPETAHGFEVTTPQSRVVDLGTRFSVAVNDVGNSEIQVIEGAAEVHPKNGTTDKATLRRGEAVRLTGEPHAPQPIRFDGRQYQKQLPDRVVAYEAEEPQPGQGVRDLVSVTVQRQGQNYTYQTDELIGVDVLHFSTFSNRNNVGSDTGLPERIEDLISNDKALTTGLFNFNRRLNTPFPENETFSDLKARHGLALQFRQPVRNDPGPDMVLFEVQSIAYPPEGDHFRVSPIEDLPGLKAHLVERFDVTMNSENARKVASFRVFTFHSTIRSLSDFTSAEYHRGGMMNLPFYALAVGIDFSDLGYPDGAEVPGVFIEDANNHNDIVIDPVFIGGFPPITSKP